MLEIETEQPDANQSEYTLRLIEEIRHYAKRAREHVCDTEEYKALVLRGEDGNA